MAKQEPRSIQADDFDIPAEHLERFEAVASGKYHNFTVFKCFLDGKPTTAIVALNMHDRKAGVVSATPLFVAVTDDMNLTDVAGLAPANHPAVHDESADDEPLADAAREAAFV